MEEIQDGHHALIDCQNLTTHIGSGEEATNAHAKY